MHIGTISVKKAIIQMIKIAIEISTLFPLYFEKVSATKHQMLCGRMKESK